MTNSRPVVSQADESNQSHSLRSTPDWRSASSYHTHTSTPSSSIALTTPESHAMRSALQFDASRIPSSSPPTGEQARSSVGYSAYPAWTRTPSPRRILDHISTSPTVAPMHTIGTGARPATPLPSETESAARIRKINRRNSAKRPRITAPNRMMGEGLSFEAHSSGHVQPPLDGDHGKFLRDLALPTNPPDVASSGHSHASQTNAEAGPSRLPSSVVRAPTPPSAAEFNSRQSGSSQPSTRQRPTDNFEPESPPRSVKRTRRRSDAESLLRPLEHRAKSQDGGSHALLPPEPLTTRGSKRKRSSELDDAHTGTPANRPRRAKPVNYCEDELDDLEGHFEAVITRPQKREKVKKGLERPKQAAEKGKVPCDVCKKTFSRHHDMKRHMRSKHVKSLLTCDRCGGDLSRKDALIRHQRTACRKQNDD